MGDVIGGNAQAAPAPDPPEAVTRITVPLVAKAASDLQRTVAETGLSETDVVNRALSAYEFIDSEMRAGARIIVRRDGQDYEAALL